MDGVFNGQRLSHLVVLWGDVSSRKGTWMFLPEDSTNTGRGARNGASGGKEVWFIPPHGFPAFVHAMLIRAVGVLGSEVSGVPSQGLASEEQGTDRSGEAPDPAKFLVSLSVVLEEGACLPWPHV